MATRRMFSKTITNSGKFLKMPPTSRLLYYDLGMNADDDGFCEWFTVIRMSGSTEQDLQVLEANKFVQVFDENVLIIRDWKENNYIQKDRYSPSKYLNVYKLDTECIQSVNTGKVRIGKDRVGKSKERIEKQSRRFAPPSLSQVTEYCVERSNSVDPEAFVDFYESKGWMVGKNKMKDWKAAVRTWERKNSGGKKQMTREEEILEKIEALMAKAKSKKIEGKRYLTDFRFLDTPMKVDTTLAGVRSTTSAIINNDPELVFEQDLAAINHPLLLPTINAWYENI